jgi:hypothetical protein
MFFYPFLPLSNRDHNSDSMVYINCASIARIKAENNSLDTRFSRRYIFLIANIILSSTIGFSEVVPDDIDVRLIVLPIFLRVSSPFPPRRHHLTAATVTTQTDLLLRDP